MRVKLNVLYNSLMSNDPNLPHRQIRKQQRMTKLSLTENSSKLYVIKTMTTGMDTLLTATIITKFDRTKYKKQSISEHIKGEL